MSYQPVAISAEMHYKAKKAALDEGMTLKDWVERAIRDALDGTNGKRLVDSHQPYHVETETP
jgi:hypothetical protein